MNYGKEVDMNNKIKFYSWDLKSEQITMPPVPASKNVPEYWKISERFLGEGNVLTTVKQGDYEIPNLGLKHCMPFLDATVSGYQYLLHCDIIVEQQNGLPVLTWQSEIQPIQDKSIREVPSPPGFSDRSYFWQMWWGVILPEGWSALVCHPVNRTDLPFFTLSGLVDYDQYTAPGNLGFYIKENFSGVIQKGTPIYQIIPVKRESWEMEVDNTGRSRGHQDFDNKRKEVYGYYRKHLRQNKPYR